MCFGTYEGLPGSEHSRLLNMSSCVSPPGYLCPPVLCTPVWTIQPGVKFPPKNSLAPAGGTREPRASVSGAKIENSWRVVLGTQETKKLVERSGDLSRPTESCKVVQFLCNVCDFSSTHSPGTPTPGTPSNNVSRIIWLGLGGGLVAKLGS